jgi:nucleotidyltransferase/DNA polymerase involved in DNA repair
MIACVFLPDLVSHVTESQPIGKEVLLVTIPGFVQAASRSAVRRGVKVGMRARQAHALVPDADVRPFDDGPFQDRTESIEALLSTFSTRMEAVFGFGYVGKRRRSESAILPASAGLYYLDLGKLRGSDAVSLAQRLQNLLRHNVALDSSVGLSRGKFPALVAARIAQPDHPRLVQLGDEGAFLARFPVSTLPLDRETSRRLEMFGIRTLGAFARLPNAAVLAQFGKEGRALHQLAQGHDTRQVVCPPRPPSERLHQYLEGGVDNRLVLEALLAHMGCTLAERLKAQGMMTSTLELVLQLDNGKALKAKRALREPIQEGRLVGRQLIRLLSQLSISCAVDRVDVVARELAPPVMQQLDLFAHPAPATNRLSDLLDVLTARFKTEHLYCVTDLDRDHWLPEWRYALEPVDAA